MAIIIEDFKAPDVDPYDQPNNKIDFTYTDPISGAEKTSLPPLGGSPETIGESPESILNKVSYKPVIDSTVKPNPKFDSIKSDVGKQMEDDWLITDAAAINNSTIMLLNKGMNMLDSKSVDGYDSYIAHPDWFEGLSDDRKYTLRQAHSDYEAERIMRDYAVEDTAGKKLDDSGYSLFWNIAGIATDPITYFGGAETKAAQFIGKSVLGAGIQEGIYASSRSDYTINTALTNTAIAGGISSLLGLRLLKHGGSSKNLQQLNESINDGSLMQHYNNIAADNLKQPLKTANSAAVTFDPTDYDVVSTGVPIKMIKMAQLPGIQRNIINSASARAREVMSKLVDVPLSFRKNLRGDYDISLESFQKQDINNNLILPKENIRREFFAAKDADQTLQLTDEALHREIRNFASMEDTIVQGPARKYIEKAGTILREFYETIGLRANKVGILGEIDNVRGAIYYVGRAYDEGKIRAKEGEFKLDISGKVSTVLNNLPIDKLNARLDKYGYTNIKDLAKHVADQAYEKIIRGENNISVINGRTFSELSDLDLSNWLKTNPFELMDSYYKGIGAKSLAHEKLGISNFNDLIDDFIKEESEKKASLLSSGKPQSEIDVLEKEIAKEYRSLEQDLRLLYDDLTYTSNTKPNNMIRDAAVITSNITTASMLDNVLMASLSDAANVIVIDGLQSAVSEQFKALISGISRLFKNKTELTRYRDEIGIIANGTEKFTKLRANDIADIVDDYNPKNTVINFTRELARGMLDYSGINLWTMAGKNTAGAVYVKKITKAAKKLKEGKLLSKAEILDFTHWNLNEYNIKQIVDQIEKHGKNGSINIHLWDSSIADSFQLSVMKVTDDVIITPGLVDRPQIMKDPIIKTLTQFMSFGMAAQNKMVIGGLSRLDTNKMVALSMYLGIGAGSITLKNKLMGSQLPTSWDINDPNSWWYSIIERSGIGSTPIEIINRVGSLAGIPKVGSLAHRVLDPSDPNNKYNVNNLGFLGPLGSQINNVRNIGSGVFGKWNEKSTDSVLNLLPVNLPYTYTLVDQLMEGLESTTGIPYKEKNTFLRQ